MRLSPQHSPNPISTAHVVRVTAPARLHFGLFSVTDQDRMQYGGLGVMVRPPEVDLRASPAAEFRVVGCGADRIREFAGRWSATRGVPLGESRLCIHGAAELPRHSGLGSGTQLALATAALLDAWHGRPWQDPEALASAVGRGRRSAVGSHGFVHGGLILDGGKSPGRTLGALACRTVVPESWRWVIWVDSQHVGLSGADEEEAFRKLGRRVDPSTGTALRALAEDVVEAAQRQCHADFANLLYEFGRRAGEQFAPVQGGAFNGTRVAERVAELRRWGVHGVGQSSWGPAVFAVMPNPEAAVELVRRAETSALFAEAECWVAATDHAGACVRPATPPSGAADGTRAARRCPPVAHKMQNGD